MGQPYWLERTGAGCRLLVDSGRLAEVGEQLACYDRESVGWPPRPATDDAPHRRVSWLLPLLWGAATLAVFRLQGEWPGRLEAAGANDTLMIFGAGEWWRAGTALLLHSDGVHLTANLVSGMLVFAAAFTTLGRLRGALLLALASFAGNLAVAALNFPGPYRSIGASTAVFAGLGLLTGRAVRRAVGTEHPHRWRGVCVALGAGLTLLAMHGAGGLQTDVPAHAAGFAAGLLLGFAAGRGTDR